MKPYFSNETRRAQLVAVARTWLGTPFHAHAGIKGAGVDCVHLCACIYIEVGALEVFNPPKYALDGGQHAAHSLVTEWVAGNERFAPVLPYHLSLLVQVQRGDLLCFKIGRHAWHVGVLMNEGRFIHALQGVGVQQSYLDEAVWSRRLINAWRPVEVPSS